MATATTEYALQLRTLVDEFEKLVALARTRQDRLEQRLAELESEPRPDAA